ncbi:MULTISPECIES: hypothetical protein [Methylobacterium]|uniref:Uncharacterized protein n=1 Tax=Methylobacterium thuringiense TaxID=1003091 RepID=A0ABQ4TM92_9HYPH|nr:MULTISPECIES: hypothetical protein [Methylobacterium]TXN21778.1 hypothetical protein FV217_13290 [Methylobacterium sp. WL9]GJE54815.1 hypothetical protein EKPJFOCH_1300 [Methylobacterium thuringiense]
MSPHQEASDLDAAVRFALNWAKDRRSIEGDPSDRSPWPLDIVQSQKPFYPQPEVALYHLDDVQPDEWAKS